MGWPRMPGGPPSGDMAFGWPGMPPPGPGMQLPPGMLGFGGPRPGYPPPGFPQPQFASTDHPPNKSEEEQAKLDENKGVEQSSSAALQAEKKEAQEVESGEGSETQRPNAPTGQGLGPGPHGPFHGQPAPGQGPRPGGAWPTRMMAPPLMRGPGPVGPPSEFMRGPRPLGHGMGPRGLMRPEFHGQPNYESEDFDENHEDVDNDYNEEQEEGMDADDYNEFEGT